MNDKQVVTIALECIEMPTPASFPYPHLRLGIQQEKEVRQDVPCTAKQIRFHFPLEITLNSSDTTLGFRGSYVQGPRDKPFVYLCWGERLGGQWRDFRRVKVPLNTIPRLSVEQAFQTQQPLRARIRMSTVKGEPVAAMLKPNYIEWL